MDRKIPCRHQNDQAAEIFIGQGTHKQRNQRTAGRRTHGRVRDFFVQRHIELAQDHRHGKHNGIAQKVAVAGMRLHVIEHDGDRHSGDDADASQDHAAPRPEFPLLALRHDVGHPGHPGRRRGVGQQTRNQDQAKQRLHFRRIAKLRHRIRDQQNRQPQQPVQPAGDQPKNFSLSAAFDEIRAEHLGRKADQPHGAQQADLKFARAQRQGESRRGQPARAGDENRAQGAGGDIDAPRFLHGQRVQAIAVLVRRLGFVGLSGACGRQGVELIGHGSASAREKCGKAKAQSP
ncbi:MAG: hypothetical protein BWZ10_02615 [candidate division BRC1 bacterium ADurb.BinA364]|nr:MAG: hypothetical protein BWZ10_02615 [candidate division BRC1 bacterium ADurb.BinA364]